MDGDRLSRAALSMFHEDDAFGWQTTVDVAMAIVGMAGPATVIERIASAVVEA